MTSSFSAVTLVVSERFTFSTTIVVLSGPLELYDIVWLVTG